MLTLLIGKVYMLSCAMVLTSTTVLHSLTCVWSGPVGEPGAITGYKHTPVNRGQSHLQATALSELTSTQHTVEGQWQCGCNALHILLTCTIEFIIGDYMHVGGVCVRVQTCVHA